MEQIRNVVARHIVPNLVPKQEDVEEWLNGVVEYDFKNNTIDALAADCMTAVAAVLGKQVIMPVLNEVLENAMQ